jgi:hypothetical protein
MASWEENNLLRESEETICSISIETFNKRMTRWGGAFLRDNSTPNYLRKVAACYDEDGNWNDELAEEAGESQYSTVGIAGSKSAPWKFHHDTVRQEARRMSIHMDGNKAYGNSMSSIFFLVEWAYPGKVQSPKSFKEYAYKAYKEGIIPEDEMANAIMTHIEYREYRGWR